MNKFGIVKVYQYRAARVETPLVRVPRILMGALEDELRKIGGLDNHIVVIVRGDFFSAGQGYYNFHKEMAISLSDNHAVIGTGVIVGDW